jgi:predicted MFS family arabinose efflux permease
LVFGVIHYLSAILEGAAEPTAEPAEVVIAFDTLFAAMLVAMPRPPTPPAIAAAGTTLPIKESIGPLLPKLLTSAN